MVQPNSYKDNQNITDIAVIKGKQIPQSQEFENTILSFVLRHGKIPNENLPFTEDLFYTAKNKELCKVILKCFEADPNASPNLFILLISKQLRALKNELKSNLDIAYCTNLIGTAYISEEEYSKCFKVVYELFKRRDYISKNLKRVDNAHDLRIDIFSNMQEHSVELAHLNSFSSVNFGTSKNVSDTMLFALEQAELGNYYVKSGIDISFIPMLEQIHAGGLPIGGVTIIAARPGMGKSNMMVWLASLLAKRYTVGIICLEMSTEATIEKDDKGNIDTINLGDINFRFWANLSGINYTEIKKAFSDGARQNVPLNQIMPQSNIQRVKEAAKEFGNIPILMDDSAFDITQISQKITKMVLENNAKIIFIDYLQLIESSGKKGQIREQQMAEISRTIKMLSKTLGIHIFPLAQLSRTVETRGGDKKPILSDLRESGSLEQDADAVLFLYRPEYYGIKEDMAGNTIEGFTFVNCAKNRGGRLCEIPLRHELGTVRYFDPNASIVTYRNDNLSLPAELNGLDDF